MSLLEWTEIVLLLDRSGSMVSVLDETVRGFNDFLDVQRRLPGRARLTVVQFDHDYQICLDAQPLSHAPPLHVDRFQPRGMTALLDALGRSITETRIRFGRLPVDQHPSRVLFVILTDGVENASRQHTIESVRELIRTQRDAEHWQFLFLGANQDALATAADLGIDAASALSYDATPTGTARCFAALSSSVSRFRSELPRNAAPYFAADERAANETLCQSVQRTC